MKYGCDTSFLMRILTNHPQPLAGKVIDEAAGRIRAGHFFEISDLVLAEAYYSLQANYGVAKQDALELLRRISAAEGFIVSATARETLALAGLSRTNPGFVDRLIHGGYFASSTTTIACEKSFRKLPLAEVFSVDGV